MNFLSGNLLVKNCHFALSARLFAINTFKLGFSDLNNSSYYQSQFRYLSGKEANANVTKNESISQTIRSYSKTPLKKIFQFVDDKVKDFNRANERNLLALHLYRSIDTINFNEFYKFLELPDTFNSWFLIVELHMWMLMSQIMSSHSGIKLRNAVVSAMWVDVEARAKNLGPTQKKILKNQVKELYGRLSVALWVYDEGLLGSDTVLAGAIWYKFFEKQCDDPVKIEVLVRYVRHQIQHLSLLDIHDYSSAKEIKDMWVPFSSHVKAVLES